MKELSKPCKDVLGYVTEQKRPVEYVEIQEVLGMSSPTVCRHINRLVNRGLVVVTTKPSPTGQGRRALATATPYVQDTLIPTPEEDWPSKVTPMARAVYAAILELAPDATFRRLTAYMGTKRDTVNKACCQLERYGAIIVDSRKYGGRRHMIAFPNLGAEEFFRAYRASNLMPNWAEGLSPTNVRLYRILYADGPLTYKQVFNHQDWERERTMLLRGLRDLIERGAITYDLIPPDDHTGAPIRLYRTCKESLGPIKTDVERKRQVREGAAFGKVFRPPTKGRARYRKLGRGRED